MHATIQHLTHSLPQMQDGDTRTLMDVMNELQTADLERESSYNLTESSLLQLVQLSQLAMQYMTWQLDQHTHTQQVLAEERAAMMAGVRVCGGPRGGGVRVRTGL
jgi:hypothetical protein